MTCSRKCSSRHLGLKLRVNPIIYAEIKLELAGESATASDGSGAALNTGRA